MARRERVTLAKDAPADVQVMVYISDVNPDGRVYLATQTDWQHPDTWMTAEQVRHVRKLLKQALSLLAERTPQPTTSTPVED